MCFVCICQKEDEARDPFQHNSVMERAEPCCKIVMKKRNIREKKTNPRAFQDFNNILSLIDKKQSGSVNNWQEK